MSQNLKHRRSYRSVGVVAALLGLFAIVASACGSSSGGGEISVSQARIPSPASAAVAAVYLTVHNGTSADDVLEGVTTSAGGTAEVHRSMVSNGMATMKPAGPLTVKKGADLVLKAGGYHIMIMNPKPALRVGDKVKVTLKFRTAGDVVVEASVDSESAAMDSATSMSGAMHGN